MKPSIGPIPGQSLTTEPKAYPWERPPEITDPEEAMQYHLDRLSQPDNLGTLLDLVELEDMDVHTITKGLMRGAVANGIHTIDVGLLVAPVVHEFVKQAAIAYGLTPEDGFEDKKAKADYQDYRVTSRAKKLMKEMGGKPKEAAKEVAAQEQEMPVTTKEAVPAAAPKGLMARGGV